MILSNAINKSQKKILLVEDDPDLLSFLAKKINETDYEFEVSYTLSQAKGLLKVNDYDLIVSDYSLPDGNVEELLNFRKYIPSIVLTGLNAAEIAISVIRAGAYDFIVKDQNMEFLETFPATIEKVIHQHHVNQVNDVLKHVVENIYDAILVSNTSGEIFYVNQAFLKLFSCETDLFLGESVEKILPTQLISEESFHSRECRLKKEDGSEFFAKVSKEIVHQSRLNGKSYFYVFKDLTEEKELENDLRLERKISQHNSKFAALGEMAGGIAHEINTPLNVILANISLLKNHEKIDLSDPTIEKYFNRISTTGERIGNIVSGLIAFSSQGKLGEDQLISNKEILEAVRDLCSEKFLALGINFKITDDANSNQLFKARSTELVQVLLNLLNNACDAVKKVKNPTIELRSLLKEGKVIFEVQDNGIGIPEDLRKVIFDPYFSTKAKSHGLGLGLSLSKTIIESHLGKLYFLNQSGNGTCFVVELPL